MNSLLNDKPLILDEENDLFGTLDKVKLLQEFFENQKEFLKDEKMVALYGGWGTGKSSVMKTLIKSDEYKLDENEFVSLLFEAWKYEKDDNLAYSLFEFIMDNIYDSWKKELKNKGAEIFSAIKGFAKGMKLNLGVLSFTPNQAIKSIEKIEEKRLKERSYYKRKKDFKKSFNNLLEKGKRNNKTIVVFIDDLDRCEAENILNLLSAIKLFFTLGENIIFVCGVDRNAIKRALKIKYNDNEKAEEYLEKIFNITFSMPKRLNLSKLIKHYFGKNENLGYIVKFLKYIDFNTPRKLKKVLNKYQILKKIKEDEDSTFEELIPDIITQKFTKEDDNLVKVFNTIFVLYFIILYEFYIDKYYEMKYYERRRINYKNKINYPGKNKHQLFSNDLLESKYNVMSLQNMFYNNKSDMSPIFLLTPILKEENEVGWSIQDINNIVSRDDRVLLDIFPRNILLKYAQFILNEIMEIEVQKNSKERYHFYNLFKMVENLL